MTNSVLTMWHCSVGCSSFQTSRLPLYLYFSRTTSCERPLVVTSVMDEQREEKLDFLFAVPTREVISYRVYRVPPCYGTAMLWLPGLLSSINLTEEVGRSNRWYWSRFLTGKRSSSDGCCLSRRALVASMQSVTCYMKAVAVWMFLHRKVWNVK